MNRAAWVARTSRVLVAVFHRDELSLNAANSLPSAQFAKFVAAGRVDQHAGRTRYPDGRLATR